MKNKKTIMFVTGAFVSHHGWDNWITYFEDLGYNAIAPAWPEKDASPEILRNRQPDDMGLADLTLEEVIDSYANIAKSLEEKPIIIGHSLGGLITQILLNRGLAEVAVAIHSVPPQGIFPYEFTFLRSTWKVLGLFSSMKKTYLMSFKDFKYAFVNGMPEKLQLEAYEKYAIPESKRVARGGLTSAAAVDFKKTHAPLLILAGSEDHVIPAHLSYRNYIKYLKNNSIVDYKEFEGRNHSVLTAPGWETNAAYVARWIDKRIAKPFTF